MAEVTNELLFEVLKQVQPRLDRLDKIKAELNAFRGHQISMLQDNQNVCAILGRSDAHFDRIERRSELSDMPIL